MMQGWSSGDERRARSEQSHMGSITIVHMLQCVWVGHYSGYSADQGRLAGWVDGPLIYHPR
jgi:hypothetical protein